MSLLNLSEADRGQLDELNTEGSRASWRRGTSTTKNLAKHLDKKDIGDESTEHNGEQENVLEASKLEHDEPPPDVVRKQAD